MAVTSKDNFEGSPAILPGRLHYAWVIVAILAVVQIIGASIGMAAGVMVIPLADQEGDFGWGIVTIGSALMLFYLVGAVMSPAAGWLGDRYGPRTMMFLGAILFGGSMVLVGTISQPWQFFLTFGVLLALTQSICLVPLTASVSGWFQRRLGLGVGLLLGASSIGTAVLAPVLGYLIEHAGWQTAFWIIGASGGGSLLLLTTIFRNKPGEMGLKPYGTTEFDPPEVPMSKEMERTRNKVFNQHIRRTRAFWNLPAIHGLGCAGHGIILIYATYIAFDRGIGYVPALLIISIISMFSILGRFFTPIVTERFGGKPIMALALFIQGITVLVLFWAHDLWMFYIFAILFGIGFGGEMSAYLVVNRQYFGSGPIATCYGFQIMGAFAGHAVATGLAGLVLYATGSYGAILALSMMFSFVGVAVIMNLEPTSRLLIPDWQDSLPAEARTAESDLGVLLPHWDD